MVFSTCYLICTSLFLLEQNYNSGLKWLSANSKIYWSMNLFLCFLQWIFLHFPLVYTDLLLFFKSVWRQESWLVSKPDNLSLVLRTHISHIWQEFWVLSPLFVLWYPPMDGGIFIYIFICVYVYMYIYVYMNVI